MRQILFLLAIGIIVLTELQGQQVFYYASNSRPVESEENARLLKELVQKSDTRYIITTRVRSGEEWSLLKREKIRIESDGSLYIRQKGKGFIAEKIYRKMIEREPGIYEFSENDLVGLTRTGYSSSYLPLHLEQEVTVYHSNREVKSISQFRDNQLVSNKSWLRSGEQYIDSIFFSADSEPEYTLGEDFFNSYIIRSLNTSGIDLTQVNDVVEIAWVVMENGKMEGIITLSGRYRQLNQFLVTTLAEMPGDWQPALLNGKAIRYFISIPLNFMQYEANFQELELTSGMLLYTKY